MRALIVGGGMAGLRAAEAIRKAGFAGDVTVAGAEPHMPYNRPPLSKDAIGAEFDPAGLAFRVSKAARDVDWHLGAEAVAADLKGRTVTLADGTALDFDGLVIASGVRPRRLDLPGPALSYGEGGRHVIRTVDDLEPLRKDLARAARVVVLGAGFIGCEVAAAARARGLDVTVVAPEPLPMQRPLGDELAAALLRRHEAAGVAFRLGTVPTGFGGTSRIESVSLSDGTVLEADVVVESVGSAPNTGWLAGNGLDLTDGVVTDDRLRVAGRDDIVACGDVARFEHPLFGGRARRAEHWTVATDSAKHAGAALGRHLSGAAFDGGPFTAVPSFWSDQYGLRIQSFGVTGLEDARVLEGDLDGDVAVGYHRDGALVGVVLIGLGNRYQDYRSRVKESSQ